MSETSQKQGALLGKMATDFFDFIDDFNSEYFGPVEETIQLLGIMQGIVLVSVSIFFVSALFSIQYYLSGSIAAIAYVELIVMGIAVSAYFIYLSRKIKTIRPKMKEFFMGVAQLGGTYLESVLNLETIDPKNLDEMDFLAVLRRANPLLDRRLQDNPRLLKMDTDIDGINSKLHVTFFVGVPWKSELVSKLRNTKYEEVWIVLKLTDAETVTLNRLMGIHKQVADVLKLLRPKHAEILLFAEGGYTKEAVKFAENPKNWIRHWHEKREDASRAFLNLVKIEPDGSFTVISFPGLETLRQARLEMLAESAFN
jgi:hypothetical protein